MIRGLIKGMTSGFHLLLMCLEQCSFSALSTVGSKKVIPAQLTMPSIVEEGAA